MQPHTEGDVLSLSPHPYPPDHQHRLRRVHGGQKPPALCADLIRIFTKSGESVLDPFMGVGGVLLGAELSERDGVGIDINNKWIQVYREVCSIEGLQGRETHAGDAHAVLPRLQERKFQLVLTDVPYWQMETVSQSTGSFKRVGQPSKDRRPTRLRPHSDVRYSSKADWLHSMAGIFSKAAELLEPGRYLATFIGDMYVRGQYHCLSADLAEALRTVPGLVWKANLLWYDSSKALHLYGYQYAYIPSMLHQNILVFRKEES